MHKQGHHYAVLGRLCQSRHAALQQTLSTARSPFGNGLCSQYRYSSSLANCCCMLFFDPPVVLHYLAPNCWAVLKGSYNNTNIIIIIDWMKKYKWCLLRATHTEILSTWQPKFNDNQNQSQSICDHNTLVIIIMLTNALGVKDSCFAYFTV